MSTSSTLVKPINHNVAMANMTAQQKYAYCFDQACAAPTKAAANGWLTLMHRHQSRVPLVLVMDESGFSI